MRRDTIALTSLLAAALGSLLPAGPAHAAQSQRDDMPTQIQISDGNAQPVNAGESLLTNGAKGAGVSSDLLAMLQATDGSTTVNGPAWFGANARTTSRTAVDGIKALNKVSTGLVRTFPPDLGWTDGGHSVQ